MATLAIAHERGWRLPGSEREPGPVTVVLMRDGGTVYAGPDDVPALGLSGILARQGVASATIPGYRGSDREWAALQQCVRERFDGFAVEIVDQIPTDRPYTLAYIGGTPDLLGYAENVGGIAPHADRVLERAMLFVFQPAGTDARALCETTAHEIGHTLGLDHSRDCTDIMSYETCGPKEFRLPPAPCGEWEDRSCEDGRSVQSSQQLLALAVGRVPSTHTPEPQPQPEPTRIAARPTIEVRRSADATAGQPFAVFVDVGEADVEHVDLYWYAQQGYRLRCGEDGPIPFECEQRGSVYRFILHPDTAGTRKFFARVTDAQGRLTKTPTYRVTMARR